MTEPDVEEIVARIEACLVRYPVELEQHEIRALIASWRKRGEALLEARATLIHAYDNAVVRATIRTIDASLKDKP
jgi:hypothetical protein